MMKLVEVGSKKLAQALAERDRFLSSRPELLVLQRKIDKRLMNAQTDHNRMVLIHDLMMESFLEMNGKLQRITGSR